MNKEPKHFYEFGPFHLDVEEGELWRGVERVPLEPKPYEVLLLLVRNGGRVLRKDDFLREVWAESFVEEKNITDNISILRQTLGDDPKQPRYIETLYRRGYRFVADVRETREEGVAIVEQTKTHILIEEEHRPPPTEISGSDGHSHNEMAVATLARPPARKARLLSPVTVTLALLLLGGLTLVAYFALRSKTEQVKGQVPLARSIAVLPFKPLVRESSNPALELGMTDALINKLSNIRQVIVRPTNSVLKYAAEGQDLRAAGRELGVDVLLDGRVQKVGERIRLSVQLVRAIDGAPVWADRFDEKFNDIFAVQDSISERVAAALALQLTGEELQGLGKRYTESVEAYQLYLKGRQHWSTFTREGLLTSINYFNEALKKDPNYALAYTGLANAYHVVGVNGPLPANEAMSKARAAVEKALALDDNLAQAHTALGGNKILYERDWPGAERELKRAMELNPNFADPYDLYGYYLQATGRVDEALIAFKRSADLAPQWFVPSNDLLMGFFDARRYDEAIERSRERIRLEPNNFCGNYVLGMALTEKGQLADAVAALQSALAISDNNDRPRVLSELGYAHAVAGRKDEALKVIGQLKEKPNASLPVHVARIYAALGDKEQAFAWLERGADERFAFLYEIKFLPQFDSLRPDPRFAELLRRMNLTL